MRIGVIGLQGAISEHLEVTRLAMKRVGVGGEAVWVGKPEHLKGVDGVIIPGGESTTIGNLMQRTGTFDRVKEMAGREVPIMGTCAGLIMMAKRGDEQVEQTGQPLLGLIDMEVVRNAFGRQRESFEADLEIPLLGEKPLRGVFIRAPAVKRVWGNAEVLAEFQGRIVGVRQRNLIAVAFHPELTDDTRLHEFFLRMCEGRKKG